MRKVRGALCPVCSFHNLDFRALVDEHEHTHEKPFFNSVHLLLSYPPYYARSGTENFNSHDGDRTHERMADVVALDKWVMRPGTHGHLLCCASQLGQRYEILSRAREQEDRDSDGGEATVTERGEAKRKADFRAVGIPIHYLREVGSMLISIIRHKAHHISVHERAM